MASYFQQQNPWLEAAQYGRELGNTLSRAFIEGPRLRAENEIALSRVPMERALQQSQLDTETARRGYLQEEQKMLEPRRIALEQANLVSPFKNSLGLEQDVASIANTRANTGRIGVDTEMQKSILQKHQEDMEANRIWQLMNTTNWNEPTDYVNPNAPFGVVGADPQTAINRGISVGVPLPQIKPYIDQLQERSLSPLEQARMNTEVQRLKNLQNPLLSAPDKTPNILNSYANRLGDMRDAAGRAPLPGSEGYRDYTNTLGNFNKISDVIMQRYGTPTGQPTPDAEGAVRMLSPDGRPVRVPFAEYQQALTEGYKLNQ